MRSYSDAVAFRANIINNLANTRPDLRNRSGVGFWPVPIMIPVVLAKCLYLIHDEWFNQIQASNYKVAEMLTEVRTRVTHLVAEGDLGEDHAGVFLREHPDVKEIEMNDAPFFKAYKAILEEDDAFVLLGFIYSIETGSLEAIKALVTNEMISDGEFAKLHMVEEVEHEKLAGEIQQFILESEYADRFAKGCDLHDRLYEQTVA